MQWRDSFHFAIQHIQRTRKKRTTTLSGKEKLGWGSQSSTLDTYLILLPISGFKKHPPWASGMFGFHDSFVRPVLRSQPCMHTHMCMLHVHVQHLPIYTHKQAHTNTHFQWPKNSQELFFKQGYSLLLIEPDFRTGAGHLWCKSNYFNAEKPFLRHRKIS